MKKLTILFALLILVGTVQAQTQLTRQGCIVTHTIIPTDITCAGACDGSVFLATTGGTPPYVITGPIPGSPITYTSATTLGPLCAGSYTLDFIDAMGCTDVITITMLDPMPVIYTPTIVDESSPGACDGSITITPTGGTTPYLYSIDCGATFLPTNVFTGLCAGNYDLMVIDANGCGDPCITYTLNSTPGCGLVSTVTGEFDALCNGDCNGGALVTTTGGTLPYIISGPFPGSPLTYTSVATIGGLCAGTHTLLIEDAMGCPDLAVITISEPPALVAAAAWVADESIPGSCDGAATGTATGGTPPYAYLWIDCSTGLLTGDTSPTTSTLCAGDYALVVVDGNGCSDTTSCVTIAGGCAITTTYTYNEPSCSYSCDGDIFIAATGGTPPFTINIPWTGGDTTFSSVINFTGICPGAYTFVVEDATGCQDFFVITMFGPPPIFTTTSSTDETSVGACDGTATVLATGGSPSFTYTWYECPTFTPIGQTTATATGLCAGQYAAIVEDANGCADTTGCVTIGSGGCFIVSTYTTVNATCNGDCDGQIFVVSTGGMPPYMVDYGIGTFTYTSATTITGLCAGTYNLSITDALGCTDFMTATITEPSAVVLTTTVTDESGTGACDGEILATGSGGNGSPYLYYINGAGPTTGIPDYTFTGMCAGTYEICTQDIMGCQVCDSVTVGTSVGIWEEEFGFEIIVYPNPTDGSFFIETHDTYGETTITVFDVNGRTVYEQTHYLVAGEPIELEIVVEAGTYVMQHNNGTATSYSRLVINR